jgi:predicted TIM-barrel fold metal-dependent hydrolase
MGLFVMIHVAEPVGREYPGKGRQGPGDAWKFARNHPELRIAASHWGGGLVAYETMPESRMVLRNVVYDTAAAPFVYGAEIFDLCSMPWLAGKILYGSDFPLLRYPRFGAMMDASGMTPRTREDVESANALRFLAAPGASAAG